MADYSDLINKYNQPEQEPQLFEGPQVVPTPKENTSDYSNLISRFSVPEQEEVSTDPNEPFKGLTYTEDDLVKDMFFKPILEYMVDRRGPQMKEKDRREVVELYTNNLRGFMGGNSVRALAETTYLNSVSDDEEKMARAGQAYALFENMQGLFSEETSFSEKAEGVQDYVRSALMDPTNLFGFGLSKIGTGVGFKAGSQIPMLAARKAFKRKLAETGSREVAQKFGERVFSRQAVRQQVELAAKIAQREKVEQAVKDSITKKLFDTRGLREIGTMAGFEAAVGASTDYLYQDALMRTSVQEEYNKFQTGVAAVGGLVFGGLAAGTGLLSRGRGDLTMLDIPTRDPKGAKLSQDLSASVAKYLDELDKGTPRVPTMGKWSEDVKQGIEFSSQDTQFFIQMVLGNDEIGMKGLAQILAEKGYFWKRRGKEDKITNFIGDVIQKSDPQDFKKFLDDFKSRTGITVTKVDMPDGSTRTVDLTQESFAKTFKRKFSDAGKVQNAMSQAAKALGINPKEVTMDDYVEYMLTGTVPGKNSRLDEAFKRSGISQRVMETGIPDLQNNLIRLMVANLSTTVMNVAGYSTATLLNSATDVTRAVLLGGKAGLLLAVKPEAAKAAGLTAKDILANQNLKFRNVLDPNTSYEAFMKYANMRPEATKSLTRVLAGGVEDVNKLSDAFNPDKTLAGLRTNQAVDFVQKINLVQAQDGLTKGIEFTSQLDKLLRKPVSEGGFNMSWKEFFENPEYVRIMQSKRFLDLEAKAVDETLKSTFSKSYKGRGLVGEVAGVIEDARNIPGIGLLVPFGRFFNNTVAFTVQNAPGSPVLAKMLGGNKGMAYSEAIARSAVNAVAISYLVQDELRYIQDGLSWSEGEDFETGAVNDYKYLFPYSAYKAAARVVAHKVGGTEMPEEELAQIGDTFIGQLTRQLGDAGEGLEGLITTLLTDQDGDFSKTFMDTMGAAGVSGITAATRFAEPLNVVAGIARGEDFQVPDRSQGNEFFNNSLRYVDQLYAIATGEDIAPEKYNAASGAGTLQATKMVSTQRESVLTATERVMNSIGRPSYLASAYSDAPEANNRYNQIFNQIVEGMSQKLWENKEFRRANLEKKKRLVETRVMGPAKKATYRYMERMATDMGDMEKLLMLKLYQKGKDKLDRVLKDLGFEDLSKLDYSQLKTVEDAMKYRDEFLGVK